MRRDKQFESQIDTDGELQSRVWREHDDEGLRVPRARKMGAANMEKESHLGSWNESWEIWSAFLAIRKH